MARKKPRSAKQKANDRRLGAASKARAKAKPKRRSVSKIIKRVKRSVSVAKRKSAPRRNFTSKIPLINNPTFKKAATGIGIATLGVAAISVIAPQIAQNPIVKPALAFLGGGIPGVAAQLFVGGGLGSLSGIFGGGNGAASAGNGGFA